MKYLDDLRNLNQLIGRVSSRVVVDALPADAAADVMEQIGAGLRRLQGVQVAVAARYAALGMFQAEGHRDAAAWLKAKQGVSGRDAKRVGDAARAVSASPAVADALASGLAGVDHAAALASLAERTRSGDIDSPVVEELLSRAQVSPEVFGHDVRRAEIYATGLDENALALARRAGRRCGSLWAMAVWSC